MKKTAKILALLIAVLCLFCACKGNTDVATPYDTAVYTADTELGQGDKTVIVKVTDDKANTVTFTIHTDAKLLGDALTEHKLIAGDETSTGLYIKAVNGVTADYDVDKAYWGFFKNSEYMMTGVDSTEFTDGETYELVYTKG